MQDVCFHEPYRFESNQKQLHKLIRDKTVWAIVKRNFVSMDVSLRLKSLKT